MDSEPTVELPSPSPASVRRRRQPAWRSSLRSRPYALPLSPPRSARRSPVFDSRLLPCGRRLSSAQFALVRLCGARRAAVSPPPSRRRGRELARPQDLRPLWALETTALARLRFSLRPSLRRAPRTQADRDRQSDDRLAGRPRFFPKGRALRVWLRRGASH